MTFHSTRCLIGIPIELGGIIPYIIQPTGVLITAHLNLSNMSAGPRLVQLQSDLEFAVRKGLVFHRCCPKIFWKNWESRIECLYILYIYIYNDFDFAELWSIRSCRALYKFSWSPFRWCPRKFGFGRPPVVPLVVQTLRCKIWSHGAFADVSWQCRHSSFQPCGQVCAWVSHTSGQNMRICRLCNCRTKWLRIGLQGLRLVASVLVLSDGYILRQSGGGTMPLKDLSEVWSCMNAKQVSWLCTTGTVVPLEDTKSRDRRLLKQELHNRQLPNSRAELCRRLLRMFQ